MNSIILILYNSLILDAPWCNLKPTHASWKFIDTKFESTKPEKWSMDKHIKGRNEPCNIVYVVKLFIFILIIFIP